MNQAVFISQNELAKKLVSALEGNVSGEEFIKQLLLEQVYMPIKDERSCKPGCKYQLV